MARARRFCVLLATAIALLGLLLLLGSRTAARMREQLPPRQQLVQRLGLTDFALWSEARYTRHLSQADLFSAFQEAPGALDHFPAASIVPPPNIRQSTSLRVAKKGDR